MKENKTRVSHTFMCLLSYKIICPFLICLFEMFNYKYVFAKLKAQRSKKENMSHVGETCLHALVRADRYHGLVLHSFS